MGRNIDPSFPSWNSYGWGNQLYLFIVWCVEFSLYVLKALASPFKFSPSSVSWGYMYKAVALMLHFLCSEVNEVDCQRVILMVWILRRHGEFLGPLRLNTVASGPVLRYCLFQYLLGCLIEVFNKPTYSGAVDQGAEMLYLQESTHTIHHLQDERCALVKQDVFICCLLFMLHGNTDEELQQLCCHILGYSIYNEVATWRPSPHGLKCTCDAGLTLEEAPLVSCQHAPMVSQGWGWVEGR